VDKIVKVEVRATHDNWDSDEGLVHLGLELQCKGLTSILTITLRGLEHELLGLVSSGSDIVLSDVKRISSKLTHSLGAVNVTIGWVTHTASGLARVPAMVIEGLWIVLESTDGVISINVIEI
jgi:hypothetical protein